MPSPRLPAAPRLAAVDALRGLVMVLMTLDHASGAFNAGRLVSDSARGWVPGAALDPRQFATRWVTHLCAPTFVFLAGLSLSLSAERRRARGEPPGKQDRFLVTRGLFIAACDPLWMSWAFGVKDRLLFQVLYAIGMSFVAMAGLRRLSPPRSGRPRRNGGPRRSTPRALAVLSCSSAREALPARSPSCSSPAARPGPSSWPTRSSPGSP